MNNDRMTNVPDLQGELVETFIDNFKA